MGNGFRDVGIHYKGRVILVQILPKIATRCRLSNIKKAKLKVCLCEKSRQNEKCKQSFTNFFFEIKIHIFIFCSEKISSK